MGLALVIAFLFILGFTIFNAQISTNQPAKNKSAINSFDVWDKAFYAIFFISFIVCCIFAYIFDGYPSDMSCWSSWGQRLSIVGTSGFYSSDYFCDYPPGYIYVLGLLAKISDTFQLSANGINFINKLPAIISDMILFYMLFQLGKRFFESKTALILSSLFMLSPVFRLDSVIWGQIESVLMVLLIASLLKMYDKRYISSVLLYVIAILVKPQALIAAPIYLLALLESRSVKTILYSVMSGLLLLVLIIMPFSPSWQMYSGFSAFIHALNPLWIIERYMSTLASYPYFTVNAFNLYGLLNLNWVSLEIPEYTVLLSVINSLVIAAAVAGSAFIFFKVKNRGSKLALGCYFLFGFLFTFAFKMHERYIILPILFLLLDFFFSRNKKMLYLYIGFSIVGYLNLFYVLQLVQSTGAAPAYLITAPISFLEVLLFIASVWIIYTDYVKTNNPDKTKKRICNFSGNIKNFGQKCNLDKQSKMVHTDYIALAIIVLIYSVIAYTNLGDIKAPQTFYQPENEIDTFVITFKRAETINEIDYYCGIGDLDMNPGISFEYSTDGKIWVPILGTRCSIKDVFRWEVEEIEPIYAKYLRGTSQLENYMLFEAGFRNTDGELAEIDSIDGIGNSNYAAIVDEQSLVTNKPSYMNSTYFDEIYHPRTAYEHLHMMPYYETTHPPLGKLIMSIGIMIFGMSPFGWRCMGTLAGVIMLPLLYMLLKKMFGRTRYSVIGTLLFAFDFMHFSLTRIGTIDSYPVLFIICMYYFMYRFGEEALAWSKGEPAEYNKMLKNLFLSGLFMGLGCASKWTAVYASVGLAAEFLVIMLFVYKNTKQNKIKIFRVFTAKTCAWCLLFFILIPGMIYTLSYLPISMVDGYGNVFEVMWNNQKSMLDYHSTLEGTHPYASEWYTWPFVYKPMWAYQAPELSIAENEIGCISIFQNPLLSWLSIAAFFYSLYVGLRKNDKRVLFLLIGFLSQYLPWIFVPRYALQYHFFASMPFLICFVIYAMQDSEKRQPNMTYVSTALTASCIVLFIMFYPVISGVPVSRFWAETMLVWFKSWVFFI